MQGIQNQGLEPYAFTKMQKIDTDCISDFLDLEHYVLQRRKRDSRLYAGLESV